VHGYTAREHQRLCDQAGTLVELLHHDTHYPAGSHVLEAGCGVGAQTVNLLANSPEAYFTCADISAEPVASLLWAEQHALARCQPVVLTPPCDNLAGVRIHHVNDARLPELYTEIDRVMQALVDYHRKRFSLGTFKLAHYEGATFK
jgi:hypothetical protein